MMRARDGQCHFSYFIGTVRFPVQHLRQQMDHVNLFLTFRERSMAEDTGRTGHAEAILNESDAQPVQRTAGEFTAQHSW